MYESTWSDREDKGPLSARSYEYGFATTPPTSPPSNAAPSPWLAIGLKALGALALLGALVFVVHASGLVPGFRAHGGSRPASPRDLIPTAPKTARDVTAAALWSEYQSNEKAANARYKGEALDVTGQVAGMDTDLVGSVIVRLESPNPFSPTRAYLADSSAPPGRGSEVTMRCQGAGMMLGSPVLRDCVVR